jgi:hypothetical protein
VKNERDRLTPIPDRDSAYMTNAVATSQRGCASRGSSRTCGATANLQQKVLSGGK